MPAPEGDPPHAPRPPRPTTTTSQAAASAAEQRRTERKLDGASSRAGGPQTIEVSNLVDLVEDGDVTTTSGTLFLTSKGLWSVNWDARFIPGTNADIVDVYVTLDGDSLGQWNAELWTTNSLTQLLRGSFQLELEQGEHTVALTIYSSNVDPAVMTVPRFTTIAYRWPGDLPT